MADETTSLTPRGETLDLPKLAHLALRASSGEALPALTEAILACRHPSF